MQSRIKALRSQSNGSLVVDIVVSHGFFIDETPASFTRRSPEFCDYCAITSYKLDLDISGNLSMELLTEGDDSHVKTKTIAPEGH